MEPTIKAVVFDLGGVLIDWNPEYLYRKIFPSDEKMRTFLATVCTPDWNEEQDRGRSLREGTDLLIRDFPGYEQEIRAFYGRWEEMLGGAIEGTVDILRQLKEEKRVPLYALTNWSHETFPIVLERFEFLQWFDGIVVSGREGSRKPFPEFFQVLLDRFKLAAPQSLFIDDNLRNLEGARVVGFKTIPFTSPEELRKSLASFSLEERPPDFH